VADRLKHPERFPSEDVDERVHGLSSQRIWQDLTEESGYGHSYESVRR
jgi:hypothetical protein